MYTDANGTREFSRRRCRSPVRVTWLSRYFAGWRYAYPAYRSLTA